MQDIFRYYANQRLKPNHIVSQWYMYLDDLKKQVGLLYNTLNCEKLMFLGDGDGVSILLALMLAENKEKCIKHIYVFDIDERELNLYKRIAKDNNVTEFVDFQVVRYNIFDKVPDKYVNMFDAFYINPPYSSTTSPKGVGFHLWLERCIEMSDSNAKGCIVYPVEDRDQNAIDEIKENLFSYVEDKSFKILCLPGDLSHRYDETACISKNLIVEKTENTVSQYKGCKIPFDIAKSLYHNNLLPHYILDDNTELGRPVEF